MADQPSLPTYKTVATVLEREKGSGLALLGWTAARTLLIAPPMLIVGVPAKQAIAGAVLASGFISLFTLLRIYDASKTRPSLRGAEVGQLCSSRRRGAANRR